MTAHADELNLLLEKLDRMAAQAVSPSTDAIDEILDGPRRTTQTHSIRNHPVMENFRRELSDGLIRADTAGQLLKLISAALSKFA